MQPGDLLFVHDRDPYSRLIQLGQWVRYRRVASKPWRWNHVAIVDSDWSVVEAVAGGVRRAPIQRYITGQTLARQVLFLFEPGYTPEGRVRAVEFAQAQVGRKYGWVSIFSMALHLVCGATLSFERDGTFVCSGLVGEALERAGYDFGIDGQQMTPAGLAAYFVDGYGYSR